MTRSDTHVPTSSAGCAEFAEFDPADRAELKRVLSAVADELGIRAAANKERAAIASELASTWRRGPRMPLNLVHAGLEAAGA